MTIILTISEFCAIGLSIALFIKRQVCPALSPHSTMLLQLMVKSRIVEDGLNSGADLRLGSI
jgi:hypothetical protein